jgi:hypothetical protein
VINEPFSLSLDAKITGGAILMVVNGVGEHHFISRHRTNMQKSSNYVVEFVQLSMNGSQRL